jgi:folate-dependent phosphoribosylglycinamide formyltransferase PurN
MNIVVLCKSWNHKKVLEILAALHQQELRVRGIVALAATPKKTDLVKLVRKAHQRGVGYIFSRLRPAFSANGAISTNELASAHGAADTLKNLPQNGRLNMSRPPQRLTVAEYARQHQIEMTVVKDLNGEESVAALQRMETDILLLGGVPIIRASVLSIPKVCTLNVHMAMLPKFRGMNVAEWSIYCGAPAGVTVHQVDPGVDTGAILYRESIDVSDCPSLAAMRAKVSAAQHQVLAKCTRLLIEKKLTPEPQKKEEGKQYYTMHAKLKKIVEHKLLKGYKAINLFSILPNTLLQLFRELGDFAYLL